MSKVAIVKVSHEFLIQALGFPEGTKIRSCLATQTVGQVELTVEHEDLEDIGSWLCNTCSHS